MANIPAKALIASCEECMGWPYVSPGSNDSRGIDCSGLLVYAFKRNGGSIYHGSNTIYRQYCTGQAKLTKASQLQPGMVVFKWNPNTPAKFSDKLGDFQHIGVVTGVKPLRIVHASSAAGKVIADTKLGKWKYCAFLKNVDYGGDNMGIFDDLFTAINGTPAQQATTPTDLQQPTTQTDLTPEAPIGYTRTVTAPNGGTVNVREKPGGAKKAALKTGTKVTALEGKTDSSGISWTRVRYETEGWMMSKFLKGGE